MKKQFGIVSGSFLILAALIGCSSNDDNPKSDGSTDSGNNGVTSHVVPTDPDSGKNNNSMPDNINPDDTGNSGNTGSGGTESGDGSGDNSGNTGSGDAGSSSEWNLVFEDNFGSSSDNTSSEPSSEYWSLAPKGDDTWNRHMSESYEQAFQQNGYLYLYGELKDGEYLTGGIESRNKYDFTYGQVKCRARFLRQPQGNHTGIWMMPQSQPQAWPRYGEIDIMEHLDDQDVIYSTVHYWDEEADKDGSSDKEYTVDNNEFNVYGVVWSKESVAFTVNGDVIFTYKNDDPENEDFSYQYPFVNPFYLILSQSLGGKGTWEGVIDNEELPAIFQIDWIKVWQKSE